jgi:hypothetical protein
LLSRGGGLFAGALLAHEYLGLYEPKWSTGTVLLTIICFVFLHALGDPMAVLGAELLCFLIDLETAPNL